MNRKWIPPLLFVGSAFLAQPQSHGAITAHITKRTAHLLRAERAPDYAGRLRHHMAWATFPLRVYFVRDANYSQTREEAALDGFDQWEEATNGVVRYERVSSASRAQITVRFNPRTNDGYTMTQFRRSRLRQAKISIGVRRGAYDDILCIAAHEFGHALGIDGHSDDRRDLMYPVHWAGTRCRITPRDLNTLMSIYPSLFETETALWP
jgi:predicted Zn-dependent protease